MADIINTLRGPKLLPTGTVRAPWYILPIREHDVTVTDMFTNQWTVGHKREYYILGGDGEWHYDRTETVQPVKYPCFVEEWVAPEGVWI